MVNMMSTINRNVEIMRIRFVSLEGAPVPISWNTRSGLGCPQVCKIAIDWGGNDRCSWGCVVSSIG
jgi:hypothetical protein